MSVKVVIFDQSMRVYISLMLVLVLLFSCAKEKKLVPDGLLVTTMRLYTIDVADTTVRDTFEFIDYDALGPNSAYRTDTISLQTGHQYRVQLQCCNEAVLPHIDYTGQLKAAGKNYLVVGKMDPTNRLSTQILDQDDRHLPVGFDQVWTTGPSGYGNFSLQLRYQPDMKNGTETPGISDAETIFPVLIQ